jgi:rubrerythrin
MLIHTASEGITLAKKLENDSAGFYEELAQRYTKDAETFLSFAKDNKKNMVQIERAYYGVITDAIEGGYAFNIDPDKYIFKTTIPDGAKYADVLTQAAEIEEKIIRFYSDAAEQSKSLMADVPRTFTMVAKKREARGPKLKALIEKGNTR